MNKNKFKVGTLVQYDEFFGIVVKERNRDALCSGLKCNCLKFEMTSPWEKLIPIFWFNNVRNNGICGIIIIKKNKETDLKIWKENENFK